MMGFPDDLTKKNICLEREGECTVSILARFFLFCGSDFCLSNHRVQNLPRPFEFTPGGRSETFPFMLSCETYMVPLVDVL